MAQRFTITDLADALAQRTHLPKREAADFVRLFFEQIEASLVRENVVRVRGLGTFKLLEVDARKSVDVNTGQDIEIDSHTSVVFVPDGLLRDAVNKPFAEFETVVLNERTSTADMEAMTSTWPDAAGAKTVAEPHAADIPEDTDITQPEDTDITQPEDEEAIQPKDAEAIQPEDEDIAQPETEDVPQPKDAEDIQPEDAPGQSVEPHAVERVAVVQNARVVEDAQLVQHADNVAGTPPRQHYAFHFFLGALTAVLLLAVGYIVGYYMRPVTLPAMLSGQRHSEAQVKERPATTVQRRATARPHKADSDTLRAAQTAASKEPPRPTTLPPEVLAYPQLEGGDYLIVGIKDTEKMTAGKTLLNISIKHYHSQDFVPYICVLNNIKNPNVVALDSEIKIPELKPREGNMHTQE